MDAIARAYEFATNRIQATRAVLARTAPQELPPGDSDRTIIGEIVRAVADGAAPDPVRLAPDDEAGLSPAELSSVAAENAEPPTLAEVYAEHVERVAPNLPDTDRQTLALMYAAAAAKFGPHSQEVRDVDRTARALAKLFAAGFWEAAGFGRSGRFKRFRERHR